MEKVSSRWIRPYGDRKDDGVVQLSFTLPMPLSEQAKSAAQALVEQQGFTDVKIASAEAAADGYTFFIVYARTAAAVDLSKIASTGITVKKRSFDELNQFIEQEIGRKLVVLGACTGTDTHTVGIDAILNLKGFAGDYGLERYPWFEVYNLGSQVPNDTLVRKAIEKSADAILVSQIVTQRDVHKDNSREFIEAARRAGIADKTLLLLGGPRVDNKLATDLGFNVGFGAGTKPSDVANYIAEAVWKGSRPAPKRE